MLTLAIAAILFATTKLDANLDPNLDESTADVAQPSLVAKKTVENEPEVHKTLNLQFPNPRQQGKLVVDINRGLIDVEGHASNAVIVEILTPPRFVKKPAGTQTSAELQPIFTPQFDLDTIADQNCIKLDTYNQDYVLNLRIKVPFRTDLTLDAYMDGYIKVRNVTGVIHAHSEHSDISLLDIAGSATAESRNGDLTVRFQAVASDARLDFESYNGIIDLSLPESIAATTAIYSGRSNSLTEFAILPLDNDALPAAMSAKLGTNAGQYQYGQIHGGGIPVRLESEKGQIKIRKLAKPVP